MVRGLLVPADSEQPVVIREFVRLRDYQTAVGGWIEAVDVPPLGITTYVNEEGLLHKLPFNPRATFLWWYELPHVRRQAMLVGDVVIVGLPDDRGNCTDIPEATLQLLTRKEPFGVVVKYWDSPNWNKHPRPYEDFFEAVVWAMVLSDPVTNTRAVRVITLDQLLDLDLKEMEDEESSDPRLD